MGSDLVRVLKLTARRQPLGSLEQLIRSHENCGARVSQAICVQSRFGLQQNRPLTL